MSKEDSAIVHVYFPRMPRTQEDDMGYIQNTYLLHMTLGQQRKNEEKSQDII